MLTRRFLTVKEVAELVQVSEASVRHWIKLRQLRAIDLGREWRILPDDLEAFLATHETCRAAPPPHGAAPACAPPAGAPPACAPLAGAGSAAPPIRAGRHEAAAMPPDGPSPPRASRRGRSSAVPPRAAAATRSKE